jgi:hypothetical protein
VPQYTQKFEALVIRGKDNPVFSRRVCRHLSYEQASRKHTAVTRTDDSMSRPNLIVVLQKIDQGYG